MERPALPAPTPLVDPLVFVDVETTGLDGALIELAIIVTDVDLHPRATFSALIAQSVNLANVDANVVEMHARNGLWADMRRGGKACTQVTREAVRFLEEFNATGMPMAGSSVHFDRRVLRGQMTELERAFHYRNVDVSTLKELVKRWAPDRAWTGGRGHHRALDDCYDTVAELRHYRRVLGL